MDYVIFYTAILLLLSAVAAGWAMTLLGLPGNWLMVVAAGLYAWLGPVSGGANLSWTLVLIVALIAGGGELAELAASVWGARRAGGSRRAAVFALSRVRYREVPQEAIIGVTYAVASSAAIIAVDQAPHGAEHIKALLVGSILWVTPAQVIKAALIYAVVGLFHWRFRDRFLLISRDHDRAEAEGVNVRLWDFLFYASFGFVVTSSVAIAGVLLVFCFLIVPGIVGILFARTLQGRLLVGWTMGWLVSILGCVISYLGDMPAGATVVCSFGIALVIATFLRRVTEA